MELLIPIEVQYPQLKVNFGKFRIYRFADIYLWFEGKK